MYYVLFPNRLDHIIGIPESLWTFLDEIQYNAKI